MALIGSSYTVDKQTGSESFTYTITWTTRDKVTGEKIPHSQTYTQYRTVTTLTLRQSCTAVSDYIVSGNGPQTTIAGVSTGYDFYCTRTNRPSGKLRFRIVEEVWRDRAPWA